jgi:hypothetical protein
VNNRDIILILLGGFDLIRSDLRDATFVDTAVEES